MASAVVAAVAVGASVAAFASFSAAPNEAANATAAPCRGSVAVPELNVAAKAALSNWTRKRRPERNVVSCGQMRAVWGAA